MDGGKGRECVCETERVSKYEIESESEFLIEQVRACERKSVSVGERACVTEHV